MKTLTKPMYTIWVKTIGETEATLLDDYPIMYSKLEAFAKARELAKTISEDQMVLVRKITLLSRNCEEWQITK